MQDLVWLPILLLPVAAWSGWYLARRSGRDAGTRGARSAITPDYFKGISYLLNEQPDKAIEVFIKVLEVDSETVETHLALGNLYRRRGEVDRAIRIHQNLIARPTLSVEQRNEALLELGQDYLSAGLFDRAESLLQELVDVEQYRVRALRHVIDIYEQEKDWDKAVGAARKLGQVTGHPPTDVIAQYYCEQAERLLAEGHSGEALKTARRALDTDGTCARASLIEGDILMDRKDYKGAMRAYERVETQAPEFVPEVIHRMDRCVRALDRPGRMEEYLSSLLERRGGVTVTLALADLVRDEQGARAAVEFIAAQLRRRPSVRALDRLLELELGTPGRPAPDHLAIFKELTDRLLQDRPVYKCRHCGFPAKSLHWQCPGCKHWNTIRPIQGVEGE